MRITPKSCRESDVTKIIECGNYVMDFRKPKTCAGADKSTDYVLIFSRTSGSQIVHYLVVDYGPRGTTLLPVLNSTIMPRIENVVEYRVVVFKGFLYVVGGRHLQSGSYVNMCYQYNPDNGQWKRKASLNEPRTAFSISTLDGHLYVCGKCASTVIRSRRVSLRPCSHCYSGTVIRHKFVPAQLCRHIGARSHT